MTEDPSPGRGRLWTDPREAEEHTPWLAPSRPTTAAPPPLAAPDPDDHDPEYDRARVIRGRVLSVVVGIAIAALLVGGGVLGAKLLGFDGDDAGQPAALPAVPGAAPADARSRSVRAIYAAAKPSIVPVRVRGLQTAGSGTGFVIDSGGVIVTNAHVVKDAQDVQVRLEDGGRYVDAQIVGTDLSSDLAVLRVPSAAKLRPLALADSDKVQVGDQTLAIGYPLGLNRSASASSGIVSGVGRSIDAANNFKIDKVIQTDAAINPGNSGGPLLDSAGRVIGVNTAILTAGSGGSVGIGFAVPSNTIREVVPRLERGRTVQRAYLGVQTRDSQTGQGAYVATVTPGTPAARAGLQVGDTIVGVGADPVTISEDVSIAIEDRKPGDHVAVEVQRAGSRKTLVVTLGTRPANAPSTDPTTGAAPAPSTP
jgi:putative serine protease PepD